MKLSLIKIQDYFQVFGPTDDGNYFLKFTFTDAIGDPRVNTISIPILGPRPTVDDNQILIDKIKNLGESAAGIWFAEGDRTAWLRRKPSRAAAGDYDPLTPNVNPRVTGEPGIPSDGMGRPISPPTKKR